MKEYEGLAQLQSLLDDPVGAIAVHLITGIWGTLAVGIFGAMASFDQFIVQLAGVGAAGVFCSVCGFIILFVIKIKATHTNI